MVYTIAPTDSEEQGKRRYNALTERAEAAEYMYINDCLCSWPGKVIPDYRTEGYNSTGNFGRFRLPCACSLRRLVGISVWQTPGGEDTAMR